MAFKHLYSAPKQPWANRGAFGLQTCSKRAQREPRHPRLRQLSPMAFSLDLPTPERELLIELTRFSSHWTERRNPETHI